MNGKRTEAEKCRGNSSTGNQPKEKGKKRRRIGNQKVKPGGNERDLKEGDNCGARTKYRKKRVGSQVNR